MKTRRIVRHLTLLGCTLATVTLLGCGRQTAAGETAKVDPTAKELDRPLAAALVNREPKFASDDKVYNIDQAAFARAQRDRVWEQSGGWWQPTVEGANYFSAISLTATTLRQPLHREVTAVTGITDGEQPGGKVAEFTWHFTDLTEPVALYTGAKTGNHAGQATFRRYDDGWRIVDVRTSNGQDGENDRPFKVDAYFAANRTLIDMCYVAISWDSYNTDFNTYYLAPYVAPPNTSSSVDPRYRSGGVKTGTELRNALTPTYIKTLPDHDGFGREYRFEVSADGQHATISSPGPDGRFATGDDFVIRDGRWAQRPPGAQSLCDKK